MMTDDKFDAQRYAHYAPKEPRRPRGFSGRDVLRLLYLLGALLIAIVIYLLGLTWCRLA